ncbi:hypothetical protein [Neorhodopirellula lusitana]|nr:hypothetical protein [Neorhodopirellula lusitana]
MTRTVRAFGTGGETGTEAAITTSVAIVAGSVNGIDAASPKPPPQRSID